MGGLDWYDIETWWDICVCISCLSWSKQKESFRSKSGYNWAMKYWLWSKSPTVCSHYCCNEIPDWLQWEARIINNLKFRYNSNENEQGEIILKTWIVCWFVLPLFAKSRLKTKNTFMRNTWQFVIYFILYWF